MARIRFTENAPGPDREALIWESDVTSFDLVADPMTIEIVDYPSYNSAGEVTLSTVNRSFAQADWTGEEL